MSTDLYKLTATEVLAKVKTGEISVEDYASSLLKRIETRDDAVRAWAHLDPAYVIEQAKALDDTPKSKRGPLHGVAIAVKDVIFTKGQSMQKDVI
jgi:Asp-tRNA(Asn)/Glu-tRNA(Gln) amidotransferase A subunit family amidase